MQSANTQHRLYARLAAETQHVQCVYAMEAAQVDKGGVTDAQLGAAHVYCAKARQKHRSGINDSKARILRSHLLAARHGGSAAQYPAAYRLTAADGKHAPPGHG